MTSSVSLLQPDGSMRCIRCGGTNFHAHRSTGRKVAFGFASLLGGTNQVQCMACGKNYTIQAPMPASRPTPVRGRPQRPDQPPKEMSTARVFISIGLLMAVPLVIMLWAVFRT